MSALGYKCSREYEVEAVRARGYAWRGLYVKYCGFVNVRDAIKDSHQHEEKIRTFRQIGFTRRLGTFRDAQFTTEMLFSVGHVFM